MPGAKSGCCLIIFLLAAIVSPVLEAQPLSQFQAADARVLAPGKHVFAVAPTHHPALRVWITVPPATNATTPIVFALHGVTRAGAAVRDAWSDAAAERGMIVVTPEFDTKGYPKAALYNLGNTHASDGQRLPEARWTFAVIEEVFDAVKARTGSEVRGYALYGHSAGGQAAHRLLMQLSGNRATKVISANAGYYLMPGDAAFPFGFKGAGLSAEDECRAYSVPMIVLLGELDNDPLHFQLNNSPGAKAQGENRRSRGERFTAVAADRAKALGCKFAWEVRWVPGVGHEFEKMAKAAARLLP